MPIDIDAELDAALWDKPAEPRKDISAKVNGVEVTDRLQVHEDTCQGFIVHFAIGQNPHLTYPFGLHAKFTLPWDYSVRNGVLTLYARSCDQRPTNGSVNCRPCQNLPSNTILAGILLRAKEGIHENTGFAYHGLGGVIEAVNRKTMQLEAMRLNGLNHTRQLMGQATSLSDYRRFLEAIARGEYEYVQRLVRACFKMRRGIGTILRMYISAGKGNYQPKNYTEEDDMRGLLLWKMGGNRVAEIAHRALGLPSVTTLRNRTVMPPIIPSHAMPTLEEVSKNIEACIESIKDILASRKVVHQILMLDELATEKRLRWDHKTNCFLGVCREHAKDVNLEFGSKVDMEELFRSLDENEVHYAAEVNDLINMWQ